MDWYFCDLFQIILQEPLEVSGYVSGYFGSSMMALAMTIIVIFASELIGIRAGGKLHYSLLSSIIRAPLRLVFCVVTCDFVAFIIM